MDGEADIFHVRTHFQSQHGFGNQLARIDANHARPKDAPRFLVQQQLRHAFVARHCDCAAACGPGEHRLFEFDSLLAGFRFCQAHPGNFGIGISDGRNGAGIEPGRLGFFPARDYFSGKLAFMGSLVGQHGFAANIPYGKNMRDIGAQLLIHRDESAWIDIDARLIRPKIASVRLAAHSDQDAVVYLRLGCRRIRSTLEGHFQATAGNLDAGNPGPEINGLVVFLYAPMQRFDEIRVRTGNQLIHPFHHAHPAAERIVYRGHFQADDAPANDEHPLRNILQFQCAGRIHEARIAVGKTWYARRARTRGNDAVFERYRFRAGRGFHLDHMGRAEPAFPLHYRHLALFRQNPQALGKFTYDGFLPASQPVQLYAGLGKTDTLAPSLLRIGDDLGDMQQSLGGNASDIQAYAAERRIALDQYHFFA